MLSILSGYSDIYFNLAAEEYLLKQKTEDVFMLWQSETSVVVGKHQNTFAEINHEFIREHNIPVARRLSGGGTVFHGPGNLNFTIIMNGEPGKMVNFRKFVTPVIEYLKSLKIDAEIGTRNDLLIDGRKISGNAEHIFKQRVLHHGTLLFDADLNMLEKTIRVVPGRYTDRAVRSNRAITGNISSYLIHPLTIVDFTMGLFQCLQHHYNVQNSYTLNTHDIEKIKELRNQKYSRPEWIYGYSPPFEINREIELSRSLLLKIHFMIEKGKIKDARLTSYPFRNDWNVLVKKLLNKNYENTLIGKIFKESGIFSNEEISEVLKVLF